MHLLLKHKRVVFVLLLLSSLFGAFSVGGQTAFAAAPPSCSYVYNANGRDISQSNCSSGGTSAVYHDQGDGATFTHMDGTCQQNIFIQDTSSPSKGQLNYQKANPGNKTNPCTVFTPVAITIAAAGTAQVDVRADSVATMLQDVILKHCPQNAGSATESCNQNYDTWISTCTDKTMAAITDSTTDKNKTFITLFSKCMATQSGKRVTQAEITKALPTDAYDQVVAAQAGANASSNSSSDNADTCNLSGNPISWILCPIYDGIASLSDALLNDFVVGFLKTDPLSTSPSDPIYKIWSSFRVWGNIFLVIGLLVIVFGQSIGGGVIDAYTAKKVLPRILVAGILINISIYIVAFLVDVTNIVGQSVGNVITAPLDGVSLSPGGWKLGLFAGMSTLVGGAAVGIAGFLAYTAGVLGTALAVGSFMPFILLFIVLPVFLAIALMYITLVLRKAIIIALLLISPVAFALYCLPNTEKYFKQWWDLLTRTLMVYPIVMVIFAVADVLAYTTIKANGAGSFWGYLTAFLLQFIPLLLIPFAFKLAGGVLGRIHDVASGYGKRGVESFKGNPNDPWSRRNRARRNASNQFLTAREQVVGKGDALQKKGGKGRYALGRTMSGIAGWGNYEELRSRRNKEGAEMHSSHVSTGNDDTSRALFARKLKYGDGQTGWFGTGWREDENGFAVDQFNQRAKDAQFADSQVSKARNLFGRNPSLYQPALTYELNKAGDDEELDIIQDVHQQNMANGRLGIDASREGIWAGSKYHVQGTRREQKHTSEAKDSNGNVTGGYLRSAGTYNREFAETVNTYAGSQMRTSSIKALKEDHLAAVAYLENDTIVKDTSGRYSQAQKDAAKVRLTEISNPDVKQGETKTRIRSREEADSVLKDSVLIAKTFDSRRQLQGNYTQAEGDDSTPGVQSGAAGRMENEISEYVKTVRASAPQDFSSGNGGGSGPSIIVPPAGYTGSQG